MNDRQYSDVLVIALDIKSSSAHEGLRQGMRYEALQQTFADACTEVRLEVQEGDRGDRGDGDLIIVRSDFELARAVSDLPREFAGVLDQYNRERQDDGQLRVRMAVHRGPVWGQPGHWDGYAVVDASRLLDSRAGRDLLTANPSASLVLCISQAVFDATVRERLRHLDPAQWTAFELGEAEKGSGLRGWARVLGQSAGQRANQNGSQSATPRPVSDPARVIHNNSGVASLGDYSPTAGTVYGDMIGRRDG